MVAYVNFDSTKPAGGTTPTVYAGDDLDNVKALRDLAITGRVAGFVESRTQGTGPDVARPQYITWLNATLSVGFRMKSTWSAYQQTLVEWEWSAAGDYPTVWTSMGTAQANTWDGSDNITATTNSGGFGTLVMEVWTKCLRVVAGLALHLSDAAAARTAHGLGTMSTQAASGVAVTGGTINGATVGATTPADVDAKRVREAFNDYGSIAAGGTVTLELDKYASFAFTPHATTSNTVIIAVSGAPASGKYQGWKLEIINGQRSADAKITWPAAAKWIGGSGARPTDTTLEVSGRNQFAFDTRDGGTRLEFVHLGKGG